MVRAMTHDRAGWVPVVTVGYEDGVFYVVESNIPGLNIEAESYEVLIAIAEDVAPDLLGLSTPPKISFQRASQTTL